MLGLSEKVIIIYDRDVLFNLVGCDFSLRLLGGGVLFCASRGIELFCFYALVFMLLIWIGLGWTTASSSSCWFCSVVVGAWRLNLKL